MTRKPRQIIGSDPLAAIPKDYSRYCDRIIGNAGSLFLEPETIIHVARVQADGGYVLDIPYLDSFFKDAKYSAVPYIADIAAGYSAEWGVKGLITVSKYYSIIGADQDLEQVVGANQPAINLADLNSRARLLFDGITNRVGPKAFALSQPTTIILGGGEQESWTANDRLFDGNTSTKGTVYQSATTPAIRLFSTSSGPEDGNLPIGTPRSCRFLFNGASSESQIAGEAAVAASIGTDAMDGFVLGSGPTGNYSNMSDGSLLILKAAIDADYPSKVASIRAFNESAYGTT